jgi:hypothetical protein
MVSYIKGGMQAKGIWKQDPKANILAQKGWELGVIGLDNEELHRLYRSPNIVTLVILEDWGGQVMQSEWREVGVLSKL